MSKEVVTLVEWDDKYSVGIPLIDEHHKTLIRLTNELYQGCLSRDNTVRNISFNNTIRGVLDYVKYHFSTEERIMEIVNYPHLAEHKKEHEDFIITMVENAKNFQEKKKFVPNNFVRFLKDWVLSHIAIADTDYAKYIIELKRQGKGLGINAGP
ncbi:MAG: bacteriohemerythrin [Spirochaetaceae bacterium]|nr:bacteriohemerythrin [Spirochaetaceae bacterium]